MPIPLEIRKASARARAEQDKRNAAAMKEAEEAQSAAEQAIVDRDAARQAEAEAAEEAQAQADGRTTKRSAKNAGGPPENKSATAKK